MEVLYVEGVAIHDGLESCAVTCEGGREALAEGGWAGLWSREMLIVWDADAVDRAEGETGHGVIASRDRVLRGLRTQARTQIFMRENREVRWSPGVVDGCLVRDGSRGGATAGVGSRGERQWR